MTPRWHYWAVVALGCVLLGSGFWMSGKAVAAQILLGQSWARIENGEPPRPPWRGMDARPLARLTVPNSVQSAIVLDRASGQALAFAPAFMEATAPLGSNGVSAIAAHKNTHFAFLETLKVGQEIHIQTASGDTLIYAVIGAEIIDTDTQDFVIPEGSTQSELALITCYPFGQVSFGGPLRYIVRASLTQRVMADVAAAETFRPDNRVVDRFIGLGHGGL